MPRSSKKAPTKKAKTSTTPKHAPDAAEYPPEYLEYLGRYQELGEGRRRLSAAEFDKLDDELLDLLENSAGQLSDEQVIRIQEIEFLLIDTE